MIRDTLKIHDKFSIEIKQSFDSIFKKKKSKYLVITYLFIPNALNINKQTYSKDQFYKDIRVNVRYKTPEYSISELINNKKSPLNKFVNSIKELPDKPTKIQLRRVELSNKLFATVFSSTIRNANRHVNKNVRKNSQKYSDTDLVIDFINKIKEILKIYRKSLKKIDSLKINKEFKNLLHFGDEYISNVIEYQILILHEVISKNKKDSKNHVLVFLLKLLKQEQDYKKTRYNNNKSPNNLNQERIIYKRSQLKKYVDSILFLKKDIKKDGRLAEQTIFALSAGLAMLFSTGMAFYYQQKYGNYTMAFFVSLVISYMLKDRIKGLIGGLFISKAHSVYYDNKIAVLNAEKNKVGLIKENFSFVSFEKLGPKIKKFRFRNRILNVNDDDLFGEQIIQYKKMIVLYPKKLGKEMSDDKLNSIADITRINLVRFTKNTDNPKKTYYLVKDKKLIKSKADRVYHINIIQKFYTENGIEFKRFRVVINRNGIKRIERIKHKELNVYTN